MPEAAILRSRTETTSQDRGSAKAATELLLFLPSGIKQRSGVRTALRECEFRLRSAQAHDALSDIRESLRLRSHLWKFKNRFERGQRPSTRARNVIERCNDKINIAKNRYRSAHAALTTLAKVLGKVGWDHQLQALEEKDIRELTEDVRDMDPKERERVEKVAKKRRKNSAMTVQGSEGKKELSWIWKVWGVADNAEQGFQEGEPRSNTSAPMHLILMVICSLTD
jgi:hypothetical protein